MDWKAAAQSEDGSVKIPKRWLHIHYYEALNILFRSENALRIFVYVVLKNHKQDKWPETPLQVADGEKNSTIAKTAARRIEQAKGYGYLGYDITSPLMHLNSGELSRLILSEAHWPIFRRYFKGKQEMMRAKLEEISTVRNALAHFRPIKREDLDLIKQAITHVFLGIETCLAELCSLHTIVPTNTDEDWYKAVSPLREQGVAFFQSRSEEWIRIQLQFKVPMLAKHKPWDNYASFNVLRLLSPAIPRHYPGLAKYCTYVAEAVPYTHLDEKLEPADLKKHVSLVMSRETLQAHHAIVADEIGNVLQQINHETALVKEDTLARGKLVDAVFVTANRRKTEKDVAYWWLNTNNLMCPFGENDPPEYWGDIVTGYVSDFVAGSPKYPWMTAEISTEDDPFT